MILSIDNYTLYIVIMSDICIDIIIACELYIVLSGLFDVVCDKLSLSLDIYLSIYSETTVFKDISLQTARPGCQLYSSHQDPFPFIG